MEGLEPRPWKQCLELHCRLPRGCHPKKGLGKPLPWLLTSTVMPSAHGTPFPGEPVQGETGPLICLLTTTVPAAGRWTHCQDCSGKSAHTAPCRCLPKPTPVYRDGSTRETAPKNPLPDPHPPHLVTTLTATLSPPGSLPRFPQTTRSKLSSASFG